MNKIHYIISALVVTLIMASMTACSDDDNYERAPEVADDCVAAYFDSSNASSEVLTPTEYADRQYITLKVKRQKTNGEVQVPIVVDYADSVFQIPQAVTFKDGEAETEITINYPNIEQKKEYSFSIHLDESYTNPYIETAGSPVFKYSVMVARWIKVVDQAQFYYSSGMFPSVYSDIYELEGQNRFRIDNFLGSGIDLEYYIIAKDAETGDFTTDAFNANDRTTWNGIFMPLTHAYTATDTGGYQYWYLMDDADDLENGYASWQPDGSDISIYYADFYLDKTTDDYGSIDMSGSTTSYAGFLTYNMYTSKGSWTGWNYVLMYWTPASIPSQDEQ